MTAAFTDAQRRKLKPLFLKGMLERGTVGAGCKAAKISRKTAYNWRDADPVFKELWDEAREYVIDDMEETGVEMARTSESMCRFMLGALRRGTYGERKQVEHSGDVTLTHKRIVFGPRSEEEDTDSGVES